MIEIFATPLGALLKIVYNALTGIGLDYGILSAYALSIVITTLIFKLILLPLTIKQTKSMKEMSDIQPQIQALQKKYKDDQQTLSTKQMELYKEHKINPLGGCLPLLVQMPILFAYFRVMQSPIKYVFNASADPKVNEATYAAANRAFLWVKDIALAPGATVNGNVNEIAIMGFAIPIMAAIAALTTYLSTKMMTPPPAGDGKQASQAESTQKTMTMLTPVMIFVFGFNYPVGLTLYWTVSNLFQIGQQYLAKKVMTDVKEVK